MRPLYLTPAMRATLRAYPVSLPGVEPGVTGAPRLAARVRFARGTLPPPPPPTEATIAALADVRECIACAACERALDDAYSIVTWDGPWMVRP